MKRMVIRLTIFVICISVLFSGCSYVAYKDYYSNIDSYEKIWKLSGLSQKYKESIKLFPEDIDTLNVVDYYCRYDQQLPLGEAFQIFLKVNYDEKNLFNTEIDRITSLSFRCNEYFEVNDLSAYATLMEKDSYFEYVLVDEEQQTIYYIYLQNLPKEQIEFEYTFLPIQYEE